MTGSAWGDVIIKVRSVVAHQATIEIAFFLYWGVNTLSDHSQKLNKCGHVTTLFKMCFSYVFATMLIGHFRYINILTWIRGFRVKIPTLLKFPLSFTCNSQKRFGYNKNTTKYRDLSWKPRSQVTILIYQTWPISEYSTENELLTSLQNNTVDKVWLFECPAKEINPDLDFTIVSVLDDELAWQEAVVGVRVQFLNTGHFDKQFTECLKKENCTMKTKSEPHTESLSGSSARSEQIRETETAPDYDDYSFWEVDVRKLCLILHTVLLFLCKFSVSLLLSPNASP